MKKLLLLWSILLINLGSAQDYDTVVYSIDEVKTMAVFPGCEKFKRNKSKLNACLIEKLSENVYSVLSYDSDGYFQPDTLSEQSKRGSSLFIVEKVSTELFFQINQSGRIVQVTPLTNGNPEFDRMAKKSLERTATRMSAKGILIEPAKGKKKQPVNIQLILPLRAVGVEEVNY